MIIGNSISPSNGFVGGGGSSFLENSIGAWSVARGIDGYMGNLIEVRESGGDTVANIGVDGNGDLDQAALLAHCGVNSGFVRTIYDQINGKNGVQTTAANQPRIVSSGVVDLRNGKPAMFFDSTNDRLPCGQLNGGTKPANYSVSAVFSLSQVAGDHYVFGSGTNNGNVFSYANFRNHASIIKSGFGNETLDARMDAIPNPYLVNIQYITALTYTDGAGRPKLYLNDGSVQAATTTGTGCTSPAGTESNFAIGSNGDYTARTYGGRMSEIIVWNVDGVLTREDNRDNQNNYYNTYTP
jgi:hypothetical protein